jgi:hypothetical protein
MMVVNCSAVRVPGNAKDKQTACSFSSGEKGRIVKIVPQTDILSAFFLKLEEWILATPKAPPMVRHKITGSCDDSTVLFGWGGLRSDEGYGQRSIFSYDDMFEMSTQFGNLQRYID